MVQTQVLPIIFEQGVETKTDSKMTLPGTLTTLENGIFTKGKRISKRNGYDKLGEPIINGAASIGASNALGVFKPSPGVEELVQLGNNELYSYSPDQSKWIDKDSCHSVILKYRSIYRDYNDVLNGDVAVIGNLECYVWRNATTTFAEGTVIDSNTGAEFFIGQFNTSKNRVRVAAVGTKFFIFYVRPNGEIVFRTIDSSAPQTVSSETILVVAAVGNEGVDVYVDGSVMYMTYYTGADIKVIKLDSVGSITATATIAETVNALGQVTVRANSNVFVYWFNTVNGTRYAVLDSALASVLAPTTIDANIAQETYKITAIDTSTTEQLVFYTNGPLPTTSLTNSVQVTNRATVNTAGVLVATSVVNRSVTLASKAFTYGGQYYFFAAHISDLQSTLFLFRSDGLCIGKSYAGRTRGSGAFSLPSVIAKSATKFLMPQAVITKYDGVIGSGAIKSGLAAITIDFDSANSFQNAMLGMNLHTVGGYLSMYDGRTVVESGFHIFPEGFSATQTVGGFMADGVYQYSIVYEWVDNMGQVHKSAASVPLSITIAAGGGTAAVNLTIPTLRITEKKGTSGECVVQIYRTQVAGTVFNNVKSPTASVLYNDTTTDAVSYTDGAADNTIASNEFIYTTGEVLDNDAPPSCSMLDVYQSRMVLAGLEDPLEFAYSKVQVKGEGVAFSELFTSRLDPFGGDISAIKLMDDKVILFKENAIFYVSGEGPNDTGTQNNYSLPQLVTSDSGCPYPKSTVLMPLGIMYKSNKGIYLLNRSLQVQYIGSPVEDFNSQDVTSADLIQDKNQVRFLTSSGVTLVYDYFFNQWSTFTNHTGDDAVVWKGNYTYLRLDGKVYNQSTGFLDDTTGIILKAATAWLKLAGIQGFQRVKRIGFLGEYKSAHQLQIKVGYDYKPAYADTYTFDATTVIASSANTYQFRQHLHIQKCDSLRFEFSDILPGSPGESYNMSDMSLEVGIKGGINRLKAAQSI